MKRYSVFTDILVTRGIIKTFDVRADNIDDAWSKAESSNIVSFNNGKVTNVMLHYNETPSRVHNSEAIEIDAGKVRLGKKRIVCPECAEHEQGECSEVHDCKVTFFNDDNETIGQCCCYSREHGLRGD